MHDFLNYLGTLLPLAMVVVLLTLAATFAVGFWQEAYGSERTAILSEKKASRCSELYLFNCLVETIFRYGPKAKRAFVTPSGMARIKKLIPKWKGENELIVTPHGDLAVSARYCTVDTEIWVEEMKPCHLARLAWPSLDKGIAY